MISSRYNHRIIIRLLVFAFTTAGLMYFLLIKPVLVLGIVFFLAMIIETIYFIRFLNEVNRKLACFFDAIRNEDTTLKFPENVKNNSLQELHKSLNNLNRTIAEIKIKSETNERFFRELIEHSTTGLMSIDPDGYVDVMNHQAKKYLGVINLSHIRLLKQLNLPVYEVLETIKTGEKVILKLKVKQNLINLSIQCAELCFGEKRYQLISLQDIRLELEENEIESWQKLIRVLTHEIMNSIAPITSLTNTLIRFFRVGETNRSLEELTVSDINNTLTGLTVIEERGRGLMHFVDNYRKITKIPNPVFEPMNIRAWSDAYEYLFRSYFLKNNYQYRCQIDPDLRTVLTDEKLFNQVMINLMTNAMDAIKQKHDTAAGEITLIIRSSIAYSVRFELSDNGCGIDESLMEKIFIPFFTTKEGGNGVGLSLSRQIVRKLNGKIAVQSIKNNGSLFIVEI
jgi:two-component system, NtrC family, nitrogen regulation sensor histidine kinase NtrY